MWLMIERIYYSIYDKHCSSKPKQSEKIKERYDKIIQGMLFMKNKYLTKTKKTFLDNTPFQHFITNQCSGTPLNPSDIRHRMPNYKGFKFDPTKPKVFDDYTYTNISGRFITNDNNKLIE